MLRRRIIPSLLLRNGGLVKTQKFAEPKYVGDPINAVKIFNEKEVDELFLLDITAGKEGRPPNFKLIEEIVSEAFMPVAYGGGVKSVDDASRLLSLGVEKIALNSATFANLKLVSELRDRYGAQCVVGVVDVKKKLLGGHTVFSHSGAKLAEADPVAWAQRLVTFGCGEILLQSVDRDGTMSGFDLELLAKFKGRLSVPLVAAGGAGNVEHMAQAFGACELSGLAVGARFVYQGPLRGVLINYLSRADLDRLNGKR
ncbi:MAG: imidazole glycerol phosphate synthase subunit HisF [Archangiaceae bacterium]|nr:imidazole glycerol phosphate synthase subunit HisF [Archangiaceae bacterium]